MSLQMWTSSKATKAFLKNLEKVEVKVSMVRDKMMIYSRLFLGMGITWYFEILNFALSSLELDPRWMVLTDTLNMCQVTQITRY